MLRIDNLTYRIAGRPLLERATATVNAGERLGLVGRNGTGKTTLLHLISGELTPDEGEIAVPQRLRVAKVAQHAPSGPQSLIDTVLAADEERTALLAEAETAEDPARIAELHERLATIEAESAPARAARILAGLGFDEAAQQRPCSDFSGGWRMRVALAGLLFSQPDLLLLDEPTNHLDLEATLWLEGYLKSYRGTLLLVSHDRELLNRVPTAILHLDQRRLTRFAGNYDRFERSRREQQERQEALRAKQMAERRHIQAFVDRFRYKASKARQAQSRLKALARMEPIASVVEQHTTTFSFPKPVTLAPPLITLERVAVGYQPETPVLSRLDLRLDPDDRIALLGANGNGKSTFVRLIAGRLKPQGGMLHQASKLKVGYFAQEQAEELDLGGTPLLALQRHLPKAREETLRSHLGRFGFSQDKAEVRIGGLSGGERARLLLALVSHGSPQILLLDEPTNHLDIDSRQALVQALNDYAGAVVLVSHDPHLIELVADRLWLVKDGAVRPFEGDLEDYRNLLLEERRNARGGERKQRQAESTRASKKDQRRAAAEARAAVADLRRAAKKAEAEIEALNREMTKLETRLADPEVYNGPTATLMGLQVRHGELKAAIARAEEAWFEAQAALE